MHDFNKKHKTRKDQLSEKAATQQLQYRIYKGHGKYYLGWTPPDQILQPDDSWQSDLSCRDYGHWEFLKDLEKIKSKDLQNQIKRNPDRLIDVIDPLWAHLQAYWRGIIIDDDTQYLPYLAIDGDRHPKGIDTIPAKVFLQDCIIIDKIARDFCREYSLFLQYEVNPDNGSSKWFLWAKNKHLSVAYAEKLAEELHRRIAKATGKNIEVFGYNCKALKLPLHPQKHTIIDTGHVAKVTRKYKGKSQHNYNQWQKFETHSVVDFCQFLDRQQNADKFAFFEAIKQGCKNLPDVDLSKVAVIDDEPSEADVVSGPLDGRSAPINAGLGDKPPKHFKSASQRFYNLDYSDLQNEPNSKTRQHHALLRACQSAKRVITSTEALDLIKQHQLFTGNWQNPVRHNRVKGILRYIGKTFDADKCKGSGNDTIKIDVAKFKKFAKDTIPAPIKKVKRRDRLEPSGEIHRNKRSYIITDHDFAVYLAINEFCRTTAQFKDGGCPEDRASEIHNIMYEAGQVAKKWNVNRWRYCRDIAHKRNIIICDYVAEDNKAYCYTEGKWYCQKPSWKRISKTGLPVDYVADTQRASIKKQRHNTVGVYVLPKISLICENIRGKPPDD